MLVQVNKEQSLCERMRRDGRSEQHLTLVLGTEAPQSVVAIRGEVKPQPVLTADDGGRQVGTREPGTEGKRGVRISA